MAFPVSPTNGQVTTLNGIAYTYNSSNGTWTRLPGQLSNAATLQISNATPSTSTTTGAFLVTGGTGIQGNLNVGGNVGIGSPLNYTPANAPVRVGYNINSYSQFTIQNASNGNNASTDIAAIANNGSDNDTYIDMGMLSSTYSQAAYSIYYPNDGYVIVAGNTTTGGGNLVLTTTQANDIIFATYGQNANNEVMRVSHSNVVSIKSTVTSTSATTGALVVVGGIGTSGNINSTGNISTAAYLNASNVVATNNVYVTGKIGVGTTPSYPLSVAGDVSLSGTLRMGTGQQAAINIINANIISTTSDLILQSGYSTGNVRLQYWNPVTASYLDSLAVQQSTGNVYISSNLLVANTATVGNVVSMGNVYAYGNITATGNVVAPTVFGNAAPGAGLTASQVGYIGMPQNLQTANYTITLTDAGNQIYITNNSNVTIPAQSVLNFPIGTTINIITAPTSTANVIINNDSLYLAGVGFTGTRTLSTSAFATIVKVATTIWYISGAGVS